MRIAASVTPLLLSAAIALAPQSASAQTAPESVTIDGRSFYISSQIPDGWAGRYLYEENGAPIVQLNADGTGQFQPHGVPAIPIKYWAQVDEAGEVQRESYPGNPSYIEIIVIQYGAGGGGNYPEGSYDRISRMWHAERNCAIILGERYKC